MNNSIRNRKVYDLLIDDSDVCLQKYANRWIDRGVESIEIEKYREAFQILHICTNISKFRDFQYRLILGKIVLKVDLMEWDIVDNNLCRFCDAEVEDVFHVFYLCRTIQPIINLFYELCFNAGLDVNRNILNFIFNTIVESKTHIIHFICVFIKQYLYRCICQNIKPNIHRLWIEIELQSRIERTIAVSEHKLIKHNKKWSPIKRPMLFTCTPPNVQIILKLCNC